MARVETIVVGGGINAQTPFTVNRIPYISNTDPPFLAASPIMSQVTGANQAIIISPTAADPEAASTTLARFVGGLASFPNAGAGTVKHMVIGARQSLAAVLVTTQDSTVIGNDIAITSLGSGSTIVGDGITSATTARITMFGNAITIGSSWTGDMVAIGAGIAIGNTGGASPGNCVFIGANITVTTGGSAMVDCTIVGNGASISSGGASSVTAVGAANAMNTAVRACCVGRNNAFSAAVDDTGVLGNNNQIQHSSCIILGSGITTTAASQCYIGGTTVGSLGITTIIVGKGNLSGAPSAVTFRLTDASGADIAGASLTIQPGAGTGVGAVSSLIFRTPTVTGAGAGAQAMATRMTINSAAITATVPIIHPAGAVGAPSISFTQANTGLFEAAAGTVSMSANGVESLRASGGGAGEVNLLVFDVTAGALRRVSIGANDSGGVGFRVLRIPN